MGEMTGFKHMIKIYAEVTDKTSCGRYSYRNPIYCRNCEGCDFQFWSDDPIGQLVEVDHLMSAMKNAECVKCHEKIQVGDD